MKSKLNAVLTAERAKDAIASKSKTLHIMLTALYQYDTEAYARACERVDDVFDYILDQMLDSNEQKE